MMIAADSSTANNPFDHAKSGVKCSPNAKKSKAHPRMRADLIRYFTFYTAPNRVVRRLKTISRRQSQC